MSESYPSSGSGHPTEGSSGGEQPPIGQYSSPGAAPSDQSGYDQSGYGQPGYGQPAYGAPLGQGGYGSSSETSVNQPFASPGGYGGAPSGGPPQGGPPPGGWGAPGYGNPSGGPGYGSGPAAPPYGGYGQQPSAGASPYGGGSASPYGTGSRSGGNPLTSPSGVAQLVTILGYVLAGLGLLAFILTLVTDTSYSGSTVFKLAQAVIALITGLGFGAVCVALGSLLKQRSGS